MIQIRAVKMEPTVVGAQAMKALEVEEEHKLGEGDKSELGFKAS